MLDPAPAVPLPEALLSRTTWLTPNETEAKILLGRVNIDSATAAEKLLAMGVRNVALKLGSQGVFAGRTRLHRAADSRLPGKGCRHHCGRGLL